MLKLLGLGTLLLSSTLATAHDPYAGLRNSAGQLCCGGSDCEVVDQFTIHSDGSVTFVSRRHAAVIRVQPKDVAWLSLPGGAAHWCGAVSYETYVTFCAFVDPGGS
jgi:hypothetical protein